jgi:hypothetical protein
VVLLDRSASMDVVDSRETVELVSLAAGLGLLPTAVRPEWTNRLAADFDALAKITQQAAQVQADLDYARVSGRGIEAAETRLTQAANHYSALAQGLAEHAAAIGDDSVLRDRLRAPAALPRFDKRGVWVARAHGLVTRADEALRSYQAQSDQHLYESNSDVHRVCDELRTKSRFSLAQEALLQPGGGLIAQLKGQAPIIGFSFADEHSPIAPLDLAGEEATELESLQPTGRGSDIGGAAAAALTKLAPRPIRAIVLFSDGRQVASRTSAKANPTLGAPLFTLNVAGASQPKDVAIDRVALPRSAFLGETIHVRATVRATGTAADPRLLRLTRADSPPRAPDRVDDAQHAADFFIRMDDAGVQPISISVPPVDGEATEKNNRVQRWLKVWPDKIHVAAFSGTAGWDFHYLQLALSRTPWLELNSGLLDPASPKLPLTVPQILEQDVLILSDVPASALDANQWAAVSKLVNEHGGSVIFVAGEAGRFADYANQPLAAALLPWPRNARPTWRVWPGDRPAFHLSPAPGFERAAALRLDDADAANRRWRDLPGIFRVMPVTEARRNPPVNPLLVEAESGWPILTEMRSSLGRAFFLGAGETWRWRYRAGGRYQDRFWLQLVRYACDEPYAAIGEGLALDLDSVSPLPGQPIRVRGLILEGERAAAQAGSFQLDVLQSGAVVRSQPLMETAPGTRRLQSVIDGLPEGDYMVRLATANSDEPGIELPLHVQGGLEAELRNISPDPNRLRLLAESTGGEMLRLDQVGRLPALLAKSAEGEPRVAEHLLWDSPYLFVFVLACFAAEWALRKRFGLA